MYWLYFLYSIFDKRREDKYIKVNDNERLNQDGNNQTKETLFQKFSSRESNANSNNTNTNKFTERPVRSFITIILYYNFHLLFLENIQYKNQGILNKETIDILIYWNYY